MAGPRHRGEWAAVLEKEGNGGLEQAPCVISLSIPNDWQAEFVWHKLSADNMDPDFVERRRIGLENFLLRVASHPILCRDKIFYLFLTQVDLWIETCTHAHRGLAPQ
ncbi:hypothetical protein GH733_002957 [Mirounga leonina]|nr:hypothetical protein GH733_002957 [Mirounga leonina]